jgi:hypothetical protein
LATEAGLDARYPERVDLVKKIEFRAHAGMAEIQDLSRDGLETAEKQEKRFLYSSAYAG